jgi:cytochrome c
MTAASISNRLGATFLALASLTAHADADAVRCEELYGSRCVACHSVDSNRIGPKHQGVFGRRASRVEGYDYSPALKQSKLVWTEETLDSWMADPERTIRGQKMGLSVSDKTDRADLIAYLRKVSPP